MVNRTTPTATLQLIPLRVELHRKQIQENMLSNPASPTLQVFPDYNDFAVVLAVVIWLIHFTGRLPELCVLRLQRLLALIL